MLPAFAAGTARAENRRFWLLSALRAHTKAPYNHDLLWNMLRPLKRPGGPGRRAGTPRAGISAPSPSSLSSSLSTLYLAKV
jgi:hypothetical protein